MYNIHIALNHRIPLVFSSDYVETAVLNLTIVKREVKKHEFYEAYVIEMCDVVTSLS